MIIIKRNGSEVDFDIEKIIAAISKANHEVPESAQISNHLIQAIAEDIKADCEELSGSPTVEDIQDMVENYLIRYGAAVVARAYINYRHNRALARKANTTDDNILSLLDYQNEEVKQENSNKNPQIASVQRDYMAGEVSKDLCERILLPKDIWDAHKNGLIHFHDSDYFSQRIFNCCLINLDDMLQNGTVISETMIEKPHTFATACNVATQIIAQVASNQYGGQSISLTHLAPFVDLSRKKHRKNVREELEENNILATDEVINKIAERRTRAEIKAGIQTIQYQVITLMTTNG